MILKKYFGSLSLTLLGFLFLSCESNESGNLAEKQTELNIEGIKIENIKLLVNAGAKANQRILELADRIGNEDVLKILRAEIGKL